MSNNQTSSEPAGAPIEALVDPSELRRPHNFASSAQPIMRLEMPAAPPPLRQLQRTPPVPALVPDTITDFLIESRLDEHEPPFRAPASWHASPVAARPERHWNWSERSTAAFLGFAAGILVIVPTVFFISSTPDRSPPAPAEPAALAPSVAPVAVVASAGISSGSWFDSQTTPTTPASNIADTRDSEAATTAAVSQARTALAEGRVTAARSTLRAAASPDTPHLWFVLAETYDPLAAKDGSAPPASKHLTDADIKFARYYYNQALTHGVGAARERLDALASR